MTTDAIKTGIESDHRADATAVDVNPDVWAFADDGEYATTWAVERVNDTAVRVETHRHEAGLDDVDGGLKTFEVGAEQTTEQWAEEFAKSHKTSVDVARDYWN